MPEEAFLLVDADVMGVIALDAIDVGDVDGDGERDFGAMNYEGRLGTFLHFGPFDAGEVRGMVEDADATWPGYPQDWYNWAVTKLSGADFDLDGRDDAVVDNFAAEPDFEGYVIDVYFGGAWNEQCWIGNHGGAKVFLLGDLDGDGAQEVLVYSRGGTVPAQRTGPAHLVRRDARRRRPRLDGRHLEPGQRRLARRG